MKLSLTGEPSGPCGTYGRQAAPLSCWPLLVPQPTLALVHREVRPFLTEALGRGEYKLFPVLEKACREISVGKGLLPGVGLVAIPYWEQFRARPGPRRVGEDWWYTTEAQELGSGRWFANLNTPEEFAEAERFVDALDT